MGTAALDTLDITELPSPPQGALAVVHACSQDDMDAERLGDLVQEVPTLAVELLRLANSSYFGFSSAVSSIPHAVALIGHKGLKNIALCIAMKSSLRPHQMPAFPIAEFWESALRRGVCGRILAGKTKIDRDTGFSTGLLQDFGLLVMFYLSPQTIPEWDHLSTLNPDSRYRLEQQLFGTTHDCVGNELARAWGLPATLARTIGCHHNDSDQQTTESSVQLCKLAQCVDWMASAFTAENRRQAIRQSRKLLSDQFGLSHDAANEIMSQVSDDMLEVALAFDIDVAEQASFESLIGESHLHLVQENLDFQQMNWHLEQSLEERDKIADELNRELELAREVQRSLLPTLSSELGEIVGLNLSAKAVSGDFYDYYRLADGRIAFCIADVSGKGMHAAILMAKASTLFRCIGKSIHNPSRLLSILNREIMETSIHGMFVSMVAGVFDPDTRKLLISNAGHLPPVVMRGACFDTEYPAEAPPLGVTGDIGFSLVELTLDRGKQLYLYTDGLPEAWLDEGERLQHHGMLNLFGRYAAIAREQRLQYLVKHIRDNGGWFDDDLTVLLLES
ncbi:MAG: HDOD domain-containing protein [Gammaproteobacteria bacterium]|nr:HDOD domain-containing protein [Gammaproteobacteria bacterium]